MWHRDFVAKMTAQDDVNALRNDVVMLLAKLDWVQQKNAQLREALNNIANPLVHLQKLQKEKGDEYQMDWPCAVHLAGSASFLKQIAQDALDAQAVAQEPEKP